MKLRDAQHSSPIGNAEAQDPLGHGWMVGPVSFLRTDGPIRDLSTLDDVPYTIYAIPPDSRETPGHAAFWENLESLDWQPSADLDALAN